MTPWSAALGVTIALAAAGFWLARQRLDYLAPYAGQLLEAHAPRLAAELGFALATLYCGLYRLASAASLGRVGRKLEVERRALERGSGYDADLAASLERDRSGA